jgi:hypothetical protein
MDGRAPKTAPQTRKQSGRPAWGAPFHLFVVQVEGMRTLPLQASFTLQFRAMNNVFEVEVNNLEQKSETHRCVRAAGLVSCVWEQGQLPVC